MFNLLAVIEAVYWCVCVRVTGEENQDAICSCSELMTEVLRSPDTFEVSGRSSDMKHWLAVELLACSHILCCVSLLTSECAISKSFPSRAWHWHISNSCWGFVFTSQGWHCGDTVEYFQISLTFNQNHVKASGGMINNFLKVFLNPSFYTYLYISFPVIVDFQYSVWASELFIFVGRRQEHGDLRVWS